MRKLRLSPPELQFSSGEGFTPEKDIFGRKEFGERLVRVVRSLEGPAVLLLDGSWGTGKTTFIRMWLGELSKVGVPYIYFDAFANDYHEDAFLAVAGEIVARAEQIKSFGEQTLQAFKARALKAAKALGRASLKVGIRVASAGLFAGDEFDGITVSPEAAKAAGDEGAKALDELLNERLENHNVDKQVFKDFRESLADLAIALSTSTNESREQIDAASDNLVFVIDELDRCRPTFSLELLEKIKHFFSVPGIVFILVTSLDQLQRAVRFAYGEVDARTYLEKFYHLRLLFPAGRADRPDLGADTYLHYLIKAMPPASRDYVGIIGRFARVQPLSLRTVERVYAYLNIVTASMPPDSLFLPDIIAVLCLVKVIEPLIYQQLRSMRVSFDQLDAVMHFSQWRDYNNPGEQDRISEYAEKIWRYVLGTLNDEEWSSKFARDQRLFRFRPPLTIVTYYSDMIDCFALPEP